MQIEVFHLFLGQLIQQAVPLRVIVVFSKLVAKFCNIAVLFHLEPILCSCGHRLIRILDEIFRHLSRVKVQRLDIIRHCTGIYILLGECPLKVCTGQVDDILLRIDSIKAHTVHGIASGKFVADLSTGYFIRRVLYICGQCANNCCIGIVIHCMSIMTNCEDVIACIQFIACKPIVVGIIGIIACHVLHRDRQSQFLAFPRLQFLGLCKGSQFYRRFFNFTSNVGCSIVQLHYILACHRTFIRNFHLDGHFSVLGQAGNVGRCISHFPIKVSIRQTIAKRILHNSLIAIAVFVADGIPVTLCICSFVPLIAYIDSLCIVHIRNLCIRVVTLAQIAHGRSIRRIKTIRIAVNTHAVQTCVCIGGSGVKAISPGIHRTAGRIDIAPQQLGDSGGRIDTSKPHHQAGIHARDALYLTYCHYVARVQQNNDILVVFTDISQKIFFFRRQIQIRPAFVHNNITIFGGLLILHLRAVVAFSREAVEYHNCCI